MFFRNYDEFIVYVCNTYGYCFIDIDKAHNGELELLFKDNNGHEHTFRFKDGEVKDLSC